MKSAITVRRQLLPPAALLRVARLALRAPGDSPFVLLAATHGVVIWLWPSSSLIALGTWWNLNTIAHNFIHRPFFRGSALNRCFALYLTALLGVPQTLWRERHLAHHADRRWRLRYSRPLAIESFVVLATWGTMLLLRPDFWLSRYLPGYLAALMLCAVHGHYEHAGGTVSHYGRLYNWMFFNDGYHCEHHARPGRSWRALPQLRAAAARTSRWPAVLRWLDDLPGRHRLRPVCGLLNMLERLVLRSPACQAFVVRCHARALTRLATRLGRPRTVAIVGGGLFPRTALVVRRVLPEAELTVIDASPANLRAAHGLVRPPVRWVDAWYDPQRHGGFDLVVFPLAYVGDREALYASPPAPVVLIHDWIWRRRGRGVVVSFWLLKRLNLVEACEPRRC
ncbi:MAG TPA: fatty acid desaturase [Pirellulales bacterium]|nr:fatty acid desaturase [Pirellulales bacterium]